MSQLNDWKNNYSAQVEAATSIARTNHLSCDRMNPVGGPSAGEVSYNAAIATKRTSLEAARTAALSAISSATNETAILDAMSAFRVAIGAVGAC